MLNHEAGNMDKERCCSHDENTSSCNNFLTSFSRILSREIERAEHYEAKSRRLEQQCDSMRFEIEAFKRQLMKKDQVQYTPRDYPRKPRVTVTCDGPTSDDNVVV